MIIDALALLPESLHVEWHHFGDGQERENLTAQAERTLPPHIRWKFWGHIPNCQIDGLYQSLKPAAFITLSSTEGLPISILEAFSAGVPAIATNVGGIPEIVRNRETGVLLPEAPSPEEVAAAIQHFYNLPLMKRDTMGAAARALWEKDFNAEKNAERFARSLKHLLSN